MSCFVPLRQAFAAGPPCRDVPTYVLHDLGAPAGYTDSGGTAVNAWGQVAATASVADAETTLTDAFLAQIGRLTDVGVLVDPGDPWRSSASAINAAGQLAGTFTPGDRSSTQGFVYARGEVEIFLVPGSSDTEADGINVLGQVAGSFTIANFPYATHAFVRQPDGTLVDLGTFGGENAGASAINSLGEVAGEVDDAHGDYHAFVTQGAKKVPLVLKGLGTDSDATALNDVGEVVGGVLLDPDNLTYHAFLYTRGKMLDLGTLPGTDSSYAYGINASGQVVGTSYRGGLFQSGRGWVYLHGRMRDLNGLLEPGVAKRWTVTDANGINDLGQIVGSAQNATGHSRAVLLTPRR
ncbi:MAG TPA: hypothetical protein VGD78_09890 [Chthoniobacterales bacterium]